PEQTPSWRASELERTQSAAPCLRETLSCSNTISSSRSGIYPPRGAPKNARHAQDSSTSRSPRRQIDVPRENWLNAQLVRPTRRVGCKIISARLSSTRRAHFFAIHRGKRQMEESRSKALTAALGQIEKQFGKGSVMRLGDASATYDVDVVSTGSLGLDIALGVGGLPRGRVVEIYGPESSGKTTLTLQVIAEAQRAGGTAAFVDAEHALDPVYAAKLGVN